METRVEGKLELPPFQRTSETSRLAAVSMYRQAPTVRNLAWEYVHECGARGATADEIGSALGRGSGTVCPRIVELREAGRIVAVGKRRTRGGRLAVVWVAVEVADE